ncbi:hypothetical protein CCR75_004321 [Bremia lactucae]|uniref:Mitotic checkpoint regulator, MAD2B-interacting-domain-containing protein n=1 Tax=Bremia lactucae TaxID=4779 RepID=A0A976FKZ0_BRELC|nr:hypothetical protein CCR75_004321 [Bremia lactucae]
MSLLVPDYANSSDDEELSTRTASVANTFHPLSAPKQSVVSNDIAFETSNSKKNIKAKTTLYLPPEIQQLLERGTSGGALSDSSDEDSELLAKHRRARLAANKRPRPSTRDKDSLLSFLPPPKHKLPAVKNPEQTLDSAEIQPNEPPVSDTAAAGTVAAWHPQHHYPSSTSSDFKDFSIAQGEDDAIGGSSKRRRTRERDIERALQEGHYETVADQITEVQGPCPSAWEPPINPLSANGSSSQDMRLSTNFWNARTGTTVSSIKPSRLQRQKHQLNQLAFDAKARDFELLEKRAASMKTKSETYAKYGW